MNFFVPDMKDYSIATSLNQMIYQICQNKIREHISFTGLLLQMSLKLTAIPA
jgi:hypothetical protein